MSEIIWKCAQVWAGRLYNGVTFDTKEDAEQFVSMLQQMEPDHVFFIEAIKAEQVWN